MNTLRDYYAILGIAPTATKDEINQAFHNLNASKVMSAEDKSIIAEAHAVLSDPPRKSIYDEKYRAMLANPTSTSPWGFIRVILTIIASLYFLASFVELVTCSRYKRDTYITHTIISLAWIAALCCGPFLWRWVGNKIKPDTKKTIGNISNFLKESISNRQKEIQLRCKIAELEKEKLQLEINELKTKLAQKEQEVNKK